MRQKLLILAVLLVAAVLFAFAVQLVKAQEEQAAEP